LIKDMPKSVKIGSIWYVVSLNWIEKWQKWVGYDDEKDKSDVSPGQMDSSDLVVEHSRTATGAI